MFCYEIDFLLCFVMFAYHAESMISQLSLHILLLSRF